MALEEYFAKKRKRSKKKPAEVGPASAYRVSPLELTKETLDAMHKRLKPMKANPEAYSLLCSVAAMRGMYPRVKEATWRKAKARYDQLMEEHGR